MVFRSLSLIRRYITVLSLLAAEFDVFGCFPFFITVEALKHRIECVSIVNDEIGWFSVLLHFISVIAPY